jgi:hypothetical protein
VKSQSSQAFILELILILGQLEFSRMAKAENVMGVEDVGGSAIILLEMQAKGD